MSAANTTGSLRDILLTTIFSVALAVPCLGTAWSILNGPTDDPLESRAPTPRLPTTPGELRDLPPSLSRYFEQRFAGKAALQRIHARLTEKVGLAPSPSVLQGRDGWLFLAGEGANPSRTIRAHLGEWPGTATTAEAWANEIAQRHAWSVQHDLPYLFVLAPNKHSVYADALPSRFPEPMRPNLSDRVVARLAQEGIPFLDLRDHLQAAGPRLFHKTDTHWNEIGAYAAAGPILERAAELLRAPSPRRDALPSSPRTEQSKIGGDLTRMMGLQFDRFEQTLYAAQSSPRLLGTQGELVPVDSMNVNFRKSLQVHTEDAAPKPLADRMLMLRDSFGDALMPWLTPHFGEARYDWTYAFEPEQIKAYAPQIVIQLMVERKLTSPAPVCQACRERSAAAPPDSAHEAP